MMPYLFYFIHELVSCITSTWSVHGYGCEFLFFPRSISGNLYFDTVLYLQILDLFFSISLSLPKSANSSFGLDVELCYGALSALEDVIAILRSVSEIPTLFSST